jgi:2-polyprenyl-3-methyl-5-hydroxy-6-metoxy-1,4-benzoquinol methylase
MEMTTERNLQEEEYVFPYHHIPEWKQFSQVKDLWWGYEYAAYIEYLLSTLRDLKFESLIDIGCGDGRLLSELAKEKPSSRLFGTDFSAKALAFAQAFSPSVEFSTEMPTNQKFDAFTAIEVFEHIPLDEADAFLDDVKKVLNPGAPGIITVPTTNLPLNPKHYRHFSADSVTKALEKHFTVERVEHINVYSASSKIIQRLLANRFFILNWQHAKDWLYGQYKKTSFKATPKNAMRLMVLVRNK